MPNNSPIASGSRHVVVTQAGAGSQARLDPVSLPPRDRVKTLSLRMSITENGEELASGKRNRLIP